MRGIIHWTDELSELNDGRTLCEGIIQDQTGQYPITIWKKALVETVKAEQTCCITDLTLTTHKNTLKLVSNFNTIIQHETVQLKLEKPIFTEKELPFLTFVNPSILTVELSDETKQCISCSSP